MPSNQAPLGALPARFRRQRVLLVGCGDIGLRVAGLLRGRVALTAVTSSTRRLDELRSVGIRPLLADLDVPGSLRRLAGLGQRIVHLAPPQGEGWTDLRTRALLQVLRRRPLPSSLVYGSTSGVYGNCHGELVNEVRAPRADTPRARRRLDAERSVRFAGRSAGLRSSILRIPGIYGVDREGGTPRLRLLKGTPVLREEDDVYTNHIQADDLARACVGALWRGRPQRIYNVNDNSQLKMGDYFDLAADLYGLPRPPRVARSTAQTELPLMLLSFMSESRRMDNTRLLRELRVRLLYPEVAMGLLGG